MMHFCWLPPLRLVIGAARPDDFTASFCDGGRGQLPFAACG